MKANLLRLLLMSPFAIATLVYAAVSTAAEVPTGSRPKIYDESLDGSRQIADALASASKANKRVLVQFGANWCGWCHKLHRLFETDKAVSQELEADYVVVLVDVNNGHNADLVKKYGAERLGLPSLVVLDSAGKHLTTKNTGELEESDHHSPQKVVAFLKEWAPKR